MTKRISRSINNQFTPTLVGGFPVYGYGGRMQYGFGSFLKDNWTAAISPAIGLGSLISGKKANKFAKENAGVIGTGVGAAAGTLVGNPMLGAQIGGQIGGQIQSADQANDQNQLMQQQMLQQQNQALAGNLPATTGYTPTFANGGSMSPKDFTLNYIQSPKYKERLQSSNYPNISGEVENRLSNVLDTSRLNKTSGGSSYYPQRGTVEIDYNQAKQFGLSPENIAAHEFGHAEAGTRGNFNTDTETRQSRLNKSDINAIISKLKPGANSVYKKAPDEIKADLNSLRYELKDKGLYDAGTEDFNQDIFNKIDNSYIKNRLQKNYSDEDIIWMMNNIARGQDVSGKQIAAGGGSIHIDPSKRGTFKAQASKMGMGVQEAASKILNAPEGNYSPAMRKKANFAKNFAKAEGGFLDSYMNGGQLDNTTVFENGGRHESNINGGIPVGPNALVEEGEVKFDLDDGESYIFSNRLPFKKK